MHYGWSILLSIDFSVKEISDRLTALIKHKEDIKMITQIKRILMIVGVLIIFSGETCLAMVQNIEADGYYIIGDGPDESHSVAKDRARLDAKRAAVEKAGVYVESITVVKDGQLTKDEINTISAQIMSIESEKITPEIVGETVRYHCHILAKINSSSIDQSILNNRRKLYESEQKIKQQTEEIELLKKELILLKKGYNSLGEKDKREIDYKIKNNENRFTAVDWNDKGTDYVKKKEYQRAIECYQKAIELNPNLTIAWINISSTYLDLAEIQDYKENIDKAKECAMKATNIGPENALSWVMLAYTYEYYHDRDAVDKRIFSYKKAVTLDPKYTAAWNNLGNAYRLKMSDCKSEITYENYRQKSIDCYQKVIYLKPRDRDVWRNLGEAYEGDFIKPISIKNYIKMIDCYRNAIALGFEYKENISYRYSIEGNHKKQIEEIYNNYIAANTSAPDICAWNIIAIEFYLDGDYKTAINGFKNALEKSGGNETIKENLNMVRKEYQARY